MARVKHQRIKTAFIRVALNTRYYEWVSWLPNLSDKDTLSFHHGPEIHPEEWIRVW